MEWIKNWRIKMPAVGYEAEASAVAPHGDKIYLTFFISHDDFNGDYEGKVTIIADDWRGRECVWKFENVTDQYGKTVKTDMETMSLPLVFNKRDHTLSFIAN